MCIKVCSVACVNRDENFVFFLGTVMLKQMDQLCNVFYVCFLSHHGLDALILQ